MSTRHLMRWYCIAKPHTQPLEFDSENGFIEHMKIEHPGKFRNEQLSLVAENSSRPKDSVFDDCPFYIGTSDSLEEHVGQHLRNIALRSLPWPDDDEHYSEQGDYLHSDNSISDENIRGTIADFISESESNSTENADSNGGSEHRPRVLIGRPIHIYDNVMRYNTTGLQSPQSYFCDTAGQDDPPSLREQLSDKTLIRLAIKEYQEVTELSTLVDKLESLLSDEYSQAEDAAHLEEALIIIQQLTNENSLDQDDPDDEEVKPDTIQEEILRISAQIPNVKWDNIDMNNLTLSASLRGPWGKDGTYILIKIKINIPTEYPELKAPKFIIEKSILMPEETYKRLNREVYELAEQFAQKKQNCLETIFTYLLGEVDFESATPFSKKKRDLSDDGSTDEEDDIQVGGSTSVFQELPPADADPDETVPSISTQTPNKVFKIGIICTLLTEYDAVCLILDEVWEKDYKRNERDQSIYTIGRVGRHNVVVALLPYTGKLTAAATMAQFPFPGSHLELFLLVGVCGGIPKITYSQQEIEVMLGDVVISRRVLEYDLGSTDKFISKSAPRTNNRNVEKEVWRVLYGSSQSESSGMRLELEMHLSLLGLQNRKIASGEILDETNTKYKYPGTPKDCLFEADYIHKHHITANNCRVCNGNPDIICDNVLHCTVCNGGPDAVCDDARKASCQEIGCKGWRLEFRYGVREAQPPKIHFGEIASGIVVTSGLERDRISSQQGVIAFDMNGFGGWEHIPCIFIKGVCHYADGHRDDCWQNFAAATAAATAKVFLARYTNEEDDHRDSR
ncbi:hypothetical protein THARTR1_04908 [Trichoderma harzianum]|uniref:RWD domain-containing protein n=1 Tax=Trichoderma harzianum TaxID=5544 RepID=A0A2K0UAA7_TRIHA|nr:hypothetical protein THARTR1_04908 [Trichoderma harzianum]